MLFGYARVSTDDQNLDLQLRALSAAGCERVFEDRISGGAVKRPGLDQAMKAIAAGDVLVVWRLDRLGRSQSHLIEVLRDLGERGIGFKSLTEGIDIQTASGRLVFHVMGALAEFERALIVERTLAGLGAAKARGVKSGRRKALSPAQIAHARMLIANGESPSVVARTLGCGRSTLYREIPAAASSRKTRDLFSSPGA